MLLLKRRHKQALEELNQVIVLYAWFLPALVEKFAVLMAMGDWDQARGPDAEARCKRTARAPHAHCTALHCAPHARH